MRQSRDIIAENVALAQKKIDQMFETISRECASAELPSPNASSFCIEFISGD